MLSIGFVARVEVLEVRPALLELFNLAYGVSPWNETPEENRAEIERLTAEDDPSWRAVLAYDGGTLVGLAQGICGEVFAGDLASVDPSCAARLSRPIFELRHLLVNPLARGRRIGTRPHDVLLGQAAGASMLLITHPEVEPALRLYRRRGWDRLASLDIAPGHPRVILGRTVENSDGQSRRGACRPNGARADRANVD